MPTAPSKRPAIPCLALALAAFLSLLLSPFMSWLAKKRVPEALTLPTTLALKPSSAIASFANIDSSKRSCSSLIRSAMLMIFDVKTCPDLFFTTKYHRFHRSDRHFRRLTDFPVRETAGI